MNSKVANDETKIYLLVCFLDCFDSVWFAMFSCVHNWGLLKNRLLGFSTTLYRLSNYTATGVFAVWFAPNTVHLLLLCDQRKKQGDKNRFNLFYYPPHNLHNCSTGSDFVYIKQRANQEIY